MMKKSWLVLFLIVCLGMTALGFPAYAEGMTGRLELTGQTVRRNNGSPVEMAIGTPYETWFFEDETHIYVTNGDQYTYTYVPATETATAYIELKSGSFLRNRITFSADGNSAEATSVSGNVTTVNSYSVSQAKSGFTASVSAVQNGSALDLSFSSTGGVGTERSYQLNVYLDGELNISDTTDEASYRVIPDRDAAYEIYVTAVDEAGDVSEFAKADITFTGDPEFRIIDGTVELYKKGTPGDTVRDAVVPPAILGMPVTGIGPAAFINATMLRSITLPDTITQIDANAFYGCDAALLCNPDSSTAAELARIGQNFYDSADTGKDFALTRQNGKLALAAYTGTKTDVTVPNVAYIQAGAFSGNTDVEQITLPAAVTGIGANAFYGCSSLEKIMLPDTLTDIAPNAFAYCPAKLFCGYDSAAARQLSDMRQVFYDNSDTDGRFGLLYLKVDGAEKLALYTYTSTEPMAVVPAHVRYIYNSAFKSNRTLREITIPKSVTGIGTEAFMNCSKLSKVTFEDPAGSAVTAIGERAFCNCVSLERLDLPANITSIAANAFENCPAKLYCSQSGETAKAISKAGSVFYEEAGDTTMTMRYDGSELVLCSYIGTNMNVTIPNDVTVIGDGAFDEIKSSMKTVTIPASVKTIPTGAFNGFDKLTTVTLDDGGKTALEPGAILNCKALEKIDGLKKEHLSVIGTNFAGCPKVWQPLYNADLHLALGTVFASTSLDLTGSWIADCDKKVADFSGSVLTAKGAGSTDVYLYGSADGHIAICTAQVVTNLNGLTLPTAMTEIEEDAFKGSTAAYAVLPDTVTGIGARAFANDKALRFINIPDNLAPASDAFAGDDALVAFVSKGSAAENWCRANGIAFQYTAE